jgi:hypothetical protein
MQPIHLRFYISNLHLTCCVSECHVTRRIAFLGCLQHAAQSNLSPKTCTNVAEFVLSLVSVRHFRWATRVAYHVRSVSIVSSIPHILDFSEAHFTLVYNFIKLTAPVLIYSDLQIPKLFNICHKNTKKMTLYETEVSKIAFGNQVYSIRLLVLFLLLRFICFLRINYRKIPKSFNGKGQVFC